MTDTLLGGGGQSFTELPRTESEADRQLQAAIEESLRTSLSRTVSSAAATTARLFGAGSIADSLERGCEFPRVHLP